MADGVTFKTDEGLRELERGLNRLEEEVAKKGVRAAARAAGRVLLRAVKAKAAATFTARSGKLFRAIRARLQIAGRGVKGVVVRFRVYLDSAGFYGRFWDRGFEHIGRGEPGDKGRRLRKEWMLTAAEAVQGEVERVLVSKLREAGERAGK